MPAILLSVRARIALIALLCLLGSVSVGQNTLPVAEPGEFGPGTVCAGPTYTYQNGTPGAWNYSWVVAGGTILSGQNTSVITVVWTAATAAKSIDVRFNTGSGSLLPVDNQPAGVTSYHYFQDIILQQPGTLGGSVSACSGATGVLTLTGNNVPVTRWDYSVNGGANWTPVANTANSYSYSNVTQTTIYRAVMTADCGEIYSTQAQVTINPYPA